MAIRNRLTDPESKPETKPEPKSAATAAFSNYLKDIADKDAAKPQPTRKLPTDRIAFSKQLDIMRAYGLASQGGMRAVNYRTVADLIKMNANTVALMNTFMVDAGFADRAGNDLIPNRVLIEYAQAYSWNPETAARKLAPFIRNTWFGELMHTRLSFRTMSHDEMVQELASHVSAAPEFKPQIEGLIDYATACGLVRADGTQLYLGDEASTIVSAVGTATGSSTAAARSEPVDPPRDPAQTRPAGQVATGFMTAEGGVQFHVSIKVDMKEMAGWTPDRIAAFFAGLAQVLAAKKGTEEI